jgi:hypothetical protein
MFLYKKSKLLNNKRTKPATDNRYDNMYKAVWYVFLLSIPIDVYAFLTLLPISPLPVFINVGTSYHPTSIPWIDNSSQCEHSGRSWENNECWDSEHSPMF